MPQIIKLKRPSKEARSVVAIGARAEATPFIKSKSSGGVKRSAPEPEERPAKRSAGGGGAKAIPVPFYPAATPEQAAAVEAKKDAQERPKEGDLADPRRRKIFLIGAYKRKFPKELEEFETKGLYDKSEEDLDKIINDIRFCLCAQSNGGIIRTFTEAGLIVMEQTGSEAGFRIRGMTNYLKQDEEFNKIMDELELEYADIIPLSVEKRLILKVTRTAFALHSATAGLEVAEQKQQEAGTASLPETLIHKYQNL
jgi:hypothetical protein